MVLYTTNDKSKPFAIYLPYHRKHKQYPKWEYATARVWPPYKRFHITAETLQTQIFQDGNYECLPVMPKHYHFSPTKTTTNPY